MARLGFENRHWRTRLGLSVSVSFVVGVLAPLALASSHCDTEWIGGEHYHKGQDGINNNCETNGHATDTVEHFWGQSGEDTLRGGAGVDRIKGQADADIIYGGYGAYDILEGGSSGAPPDRIFGENDVDQIYGGEDSDRLVGHEGQDIIQDTCCGNINEKDYVCGMGGVDDVYVNDDDWEDIVWDPSGNDNIVMDPPSSGGEEYPTTLNCGIPT